MATILRWFIHNGVRHRAYFRSLNQGGTGELVISGPEWQGSIEQQHVTRLEDFSESDLSQLVAAMRPDAQVAEARSAEGIE